MKICNEAGDAINFSVIVETNNGVPVKVCINNEFKNVRQAKGKYYFQYQFRRYFIEMDPPQVSSDSFVKVHVTQCPVCRRQSGNYCRCPDGLNRYYKGRTTRKCRYFEELPDEPSNPV